MRTAFYLRVSTADQTTENQLRDLTDVAKHRGWIITKHYKDEAVSGAKTREHRPALKAMLEAAHRGEFELVAAWSVDRLGRSLSDLLRTSDDLRALNIGLYLHKQAVDTTTPTGRMTYQILGAVSEWERSMIQERVKAGVARAKAQGKRFGRPRTLPLNVADRVRELSVAGKSLREIAEILQISKSSVARLRKQPVEWLE